jgi:thiamine-phosphate pyrophosphorylase
MPSTPLMRMIDAAVNRAGEGLRVAEDYVRFVLDDPHLTRLAKALRHNFAEAAAMVAATDRHSARDAQHDVGTAISTASERQRADTWAVCVASLKRAAQSLRSLEEYGKLADPKFATEIELIRYRLYTLEKAIDTERTSRGRLEGVRLCVLVDGRETVSEFERLVSALVEAGVGMIQLRDKRLSDRELAARARWLRVLIRDKPTLLIVNDRPDVATATHIDGVQLGQEDLTVKDARTIVGTRMLVGVSTHNLEQARAAALEGANYLGAGPAYPSQTKSFDELAGLEYIRAVSAEIRLPTFAIGGINCDNIRDVIDAGATRVAVGAAITNAPDPARIAQNMVEILNSLAPTPAAQSALAEKPPSRI